MYTCWLYLTMPCVFWAFFHHMTFQQWQLQVTRNINASWHAGFISKTISTWEGVLGRFSVWLLQLKMPLTFDTMAIFVICNQCWFLNWNWIKRFCSPERWGSQRFRQDHGHRQGTQGRHVPHRQRHQEDPGQSCQGTKKRGWGRGGIPYSCFPRWPCVDLML